MTTRFALLLLCAAPRLLWLAVYGPAAPTSYYWRIGDSLLRSGTLADRGVATTAIEPLYPLFLAGARWITHDAAALVAILQILVASAGAVYLYDLTLTMSKRRSAAIAAAFAYALYPYFIRQSVAWIELPLLLPLMAAAWYYFARNDRTTSAIACGVAFGLVMLTRMALLPVWLAAVGILAIRGRARQAFVIAGVSAVMLVPALWRNHALDGSWLPTRGGENLFVGNCEYSDGFIPRYDLDLLSPYAHAVARERLGLINGEDDVHARRAIDQMDGSMAIAFMRAHPGRTLSLKARNIAYLFDPRIVPFEPMDDETTLTLNDNGTFHIERPRERPPAASFAQSAGYVCLAVAAVAGLVVRRRAWRDDALLLATILVVTVTCSIYFPTTRLRAPIDLALMVFAGCGVAAVVERRRA